MTGETQELQAQIQQLKKDNESLLKRAEASRTIRDCLETENQELRTENTRLGALIAEQQDLKKQISTLTTRAETAEKTNTSLKQQKSVLRQKMHRFLDKQRNVVISSLFDEASDQSDETPRKRRRTEISDDLIEIDQEGGESSTNELTEMHQKFNDQVTALLNQLNESNKKIANLQEELSDCRNSNDELTKAANERCDELSNQVKMLEQEKIDLNTEVNTERKRTNELSDQIKKLEQENSDSKTEVDTERKRADSLSNQVKKLEQEKIDLKTEVDTERKRTNELLNEIDPSNQLRNTLVRKVRKQAETKFDNKQHKEALNDYLMLVLIEESGRRNSEYLGYFWNQIAICWNSGFNNLTKALEAIEKAILYRPTNAVYFYNRADYYNELDNKSKALEDVKRSLELNPHFKEAKDLLAELEAES